MDLENFLQNIVLFINEARGEKREGILQPLAEKIVEYYVIEKNKGTFYPSLEESLGQDLELYYLALFTIYFICRDAECLSVVDRIIMRPELDVFEAGNLCTQLGYLRFVDSSLKKDYIESRRVNYFLLRRYEQRYPISVPFLPYEERNKRRIVIETNTLLHIEHAPTRIVLDACRVLQEELGYEVLLLVDVMGQEKDGEKQFSLFPYVKVNYQADLNGSFSVNYEGVMIRGYQLVWKPDTTGEIQQLLTELYEWKPLCVWHIGVDSFCHDVFHNITTVLSMPCIVGYSVSEAPVLVSMAQSNDPAIAEAVAYAKQFGQKCLDINVKIGLKESAASPHSRSEFQLPEDAFVITIVGNRLDHEMSDEFIQMLLELEQEIDWLFFLIVGPIEKKHFQTKEKNRVQYAGWRRDLVDVMRLADLFVNPPRQGGGGGAERALMLGIPVVTLPDCDVFFQVGEEFAVQDLTEMKTLILRYIQDVDFYKEQQLRAKRKWEESQQVDNKTSYQEMLQQVEDWLQRGEIA